MHPFTAKRIAAAKELYANMCKPKGSKGAIPNRSIRSMHGRVHQTNRGLVWGNGSPFHGHVSN